MFAYNIRNITNNLPQAMTTNYMNQKRLPWRKALGTYTAAFVRNILTAHALIEDISAGNFEYAIFF